MKRAALTFGALTLAASVPVARAATPAGQKERPVERIVGSDALVEEKGRFKATWVHPDESLHRYNKVYLWNVAIQFRNLRKRHKRTQMESWNRRSIPREPYPVTKETRERFAQVVFDAYVEELQRSKKFDTVDEVDPGTLVVRGAVMDIISFVPPQTVRGNTYLAIIGEGSVVFELIDPETGLMQARVGDRRDIQPPNQNYATFRAPANFNALWPDVEQWARAVASDLRQELEDRLE